MPAKPPFVIHVSEMADFPDTVNIGRENGRKRLKRSMWANPFVIGQDGTRAEVVEKYRRHCLEADLAIPHHHAKEAYLELTGKPLACWCRRSDEERTDQAMKNHAELLGYAIMTAVELEEGMETSDR